MKRTKLSLLTVLLLCLASTSFATPTLVDANRLFDFAESAEPMLFFPVAQTQQINEAGADWYFRYFSGSDTYIAININGTGEFVGGSVYALGTQFGEGPVYAGTLESLLATIDAVEPLPNTGVDAITNPGNGNCVARRFALRNDTAQIRTTTFSGSSTTIVDRSELYEVVEDAQTVTVIEQTTSVGGLETVASNRLTSYFDSFNGMFYLSETQSDITTSITGLPSSNQITTTTYAPSLFIGPADQWCEGQEWFAAPVTQTVLSNPDSQGSGAVSMQTPATTGVINSIDELVSVGSTTYTTVKMTLTSPGSRTIIWTDPVTGVQVMSETYIDGSETPVSIEELQQLDLPF